MSKMVVDDNSWVSEIFLLIHDDRHYDMGEMSVRGAYATEEAATEAVVTRTASGQQSRASSAHGEHCCSVEAFELLAAPTIDVREDDPPPDPNAPRLIRDDLVDALLGLASRPSPLFDRLGRRGG